MSKGKASVESTVRCREMSVHSQLLHGCKVLHTCRQPPSIAMRCCRPETVAQLHHSGVGSHGTDSARDIYVVRHHRRLGSRALTPRHAHIEEKRKRRSRLRAAIGAFLFLRRCVSGVSLEIVVGHCICRLDRWPSLAFAQLCPWCQSVGSDAQDQ